MTPAEADKEVLASALLHMPSSSGQQRPRSRAFSPLGAIHGSPGPAGSFPAQPIQSSTSARSTPNKQQRPPTSSSAVGEAQAQSKQQQGAPPLDGGSPWGGSQQGEGHVPSSLEGLEDRPLEARPSEPAALANLNACYQEGNATDGSTKSSLARHDLSTPQGQAAAVLKDLSDDGRMLQRTINSLQQ